MYNEYIIVAFAVICGTLIPWFVNWVILNSKLTKKVSILKSHLYFEKTCDNKKKIYLIIFESSLIFAFLYAYMSFSQLYVLFLGFIAMLFVDYTLKKIFIVKDTTTKNYISI